MLPSRPDVPMDLPGAWDRQGHESGRALCSPGAPRQLALWPRFSCVLLPTWPLMGC